MKSKRKREIVRGRRREGQRGAERGREGQREGERSRPSVVGILWVAKRILVASHIAFPLQGASGLSWH